MSKPNYHQSLKSLTEAALALQESEVPGELWRNTAFLPYLCLLLPHRLTSAIAKAQDSLVAQELVAMPLDMSPPGQSCGGGVTDGSPFRRVRHNRCSLQLLRHQQALVVRARERSGTPLSM